MVKLFGLRITPFFLLILGLQGLALLLSLYIGLLLYQDTLTIQATNEFIERSFYSGLILVVLLSVLTPGFFYQTKVISYVKKTIHDKTPSVTIAMVTMFLILFVNGSNLDARILFIAALISACVGMVIGQFGLLGKYWRFLVHSGMN